VWDETFEHLLRARLTGLAASAPVDPDLPLASLGLDSLGTVALIAALEDAYGICLPEEVVVPGNFRTARAAWTTLAGARGEPAAKADVEAGAGAGAAAKRLSDWFGDGLAANPDGPALAIRGEQWTYRQLDQLAREHAARLTDGAPTPPRRVGIFAAKNIDAYAGLLGALYAGAAYVPLAPDVPMERNLAIAAAARLDAVIADPAGAGDQARLAEMVRPDTRADTDQPAEQAEHADLAYILFTSGSTGRPKGVPISHANVSAFLADARARYDFHSADRFSQIYELTFDLAVFDMFAAWSVGACVCALTHLQALDPARAAARHGLTVWHSTPSLAGALRKRDTLPAGSLPGLRHSVFCGEPLPQGTAAYWHRTAPNAKIHNIYGPTELTIACTAYPFDPERVADPADIVPIGVPNAAMRALLLAPDGTVREVGTAGTAAADATEGPAATPDAHGAEGELCMTGPQMFTGYLDPANDEGRFLDHDGLRWYRTGDRARLDPEAGLCHLGRTDHQVKIRGYRVELGEVEHAIGRVTGLPAAAFAVGTPGAELVAFVVGEPGLDLDALAKTLSAALPSYLVPTRLWRLDRAPLNRNSKIDRTSLRAEAERRCGKDR
jgi:non-ribosomal peptide synthetase component F